MPTLWLTLLFACDDTTFKSHMATVEGEGIEGVVEVFGTNCVSCHQGDSAMAGLPLDGDLCETMVDVEASSGAGILVVPGSKDDSVLYQRIIDEVRPMPPGGVMPQSNTDIVGQWIDDGADCSALSTDGSDADGSDGSDGTGDNDAPEAATAQIMTQHCAGCHSENNPSGGVSLDGDLCVQLVNQVGNSGEILVAPGNAEGSLLVQRMLDADAPMPMSGLLDRAIVSTVEEWIDAGAECGESSADGGLEDTGVGDAMNLYGEGAEPVPFHGGVQSHAIPHASLTWGDGGTVE